MGGQIGLQPDVNYGSGEFGAARENTGSKIVYSHFHNKKLNET